MAVSFRQDARRKRPSPPPRGCTKIVHFPLLATLSILTGSESVPDQNALSQPAKHQGSIHACKMDFQQRLSTAWAGQINVLIVLELLRSGDPPAVRFGNQIATLLELDLGVGNVGLPRDREIPERQL